MQLIKDMRDVAYPKSKPFDQIEKSIKKSNN